MIDLDWLIAHGRSHLFSTYAFHNHMYNQTWACCARWPCTRAPVAPAPDEPLCSTRACARLAPAPHPRPRSTRVRAPPASALHPRPCYTRACAPGVLVPVGAATCLVFVSLAGLLLVRCSSPLVLLLVRCLFPCSVATAPVSVSLLFQVLVSVGGLTDAVTQLDRVRACARRAGRRRAHLCASDRGSIACCSARTQHAQSRRGAQTGATYTTNNS